MTSRASQSITEQDFLLLPGETIHDFRLCCRQFYGVPVKFRAHRNGDKVARCLFLKDAHRLAFAEVRQTAVHQPAATGEAKH